LHRVEAELSVTRPQLIGALVSFGALVTTFILGVSRRKSTVKQKVVAPRPAFAATLLIVSAAFLVVKIVWVDRCDACFRYTSPLGQALGAQHQQQANFGGHIELLGYDLPSAEIESGQALPLTLYWRATAPVPLNYQVFVHLSNPATTLWGQSDKLNPGDFPSTRWPLDRFVWDDHWLQVLPGTPPGEYRLSVGLYQLENGQRVPVLDNQGQIIGDNIVLDTVVHVTRPTYPIPLESLAKMGMRSTLAGREYDGVDLMGRTLESPRIESTRELPHIAPPDFVRLNLFWQSMADHLPNLRIRTELVDQAGQIVEQVEGYPAQNTYPMTEWIKYETVRDPIQFWLPPDFPTGQYLLRVKIIDEANHVLDTLDLEHFEVKR
jgi:hypothetical protein